MCPIGLTYGVVLNVGRTLANSVIGELINKIKCLKLYLFTNQNASRKYMIWYDGLKSHSIYDMMYTCIYVYGIPVSVLQALYQFN